MIYFIKDGDYVKIGYSNNPRARLLNLQGANSRTLEIVGIMAGEREHEAWLHTAFDMFRLRLSNEWFFFADTINKFILRHTKPYNQNEIEAVVEKEKKAAQAAGKEYIEAPKKTKREDAFDFIKTALEHGPQRSAHLRNLAIENGISQSTFELALNKLTSGGSVDIVEPLTTRDSRLLTLRREDASDAYSEAS